MEGQKRLLRRLSVRGDESDKPSVCIGRITTQFLHAVQQKNPQSSTAEIDKSKLGWALDVAQCYRKLEVQRAQTNYFLSTQEGWFALPFGPYCSECSLQGDGCLDKLVRIARRKEALLWWQGSRCPSLRCTCCSMAAMATLWTSCTTWRAAIIWTGATWIRLR